MDISEIHLGSGNNRPEKKRIKATIETPIKNVVSRKRSSSTKKESQHQSKRSRSVSNSAKQKSGATNCNEDEAPLNDFTNKPNVDETIQNTEKNKLILEKKQCKHCLEYLAFHGTIPKRYYEKHVEKCARLLPFITEDGKCKFCQRNFLRKLLLFRHIERDHASELENVATKDSKSPKSSKVRTEESKKEIVQSTSDVDVNIPEKKNLTPQKKNQCEHCLKYFLVHGTRHKTIYGKHVEKCVKLKPFTTEDGKCKFCQKSFMRVGTLFQHIEEKHADEVEIATTEDSKSPEASNVGNGNCTKELKKEIVESTSKDDVEIVKNRRRKKQCENCKNFLHVDSQRAKSLFSLHVELCPKYFPYVTDGSCNICGKDFKNQIIKLYKHIELSHASEIENAALKSKSPGDATNSENVTKIEDSMDDGPKSAANSENVIKIEDSMDDVPKSAKKTNISKRKTKQCGNCKKELYYDREKAKMTYKKHIKMCPRLFPYVTENGSCQICGKSYKGQIIFLYKHIESTHEIGNADVKKSESPTKSEIESSLEEIIEPTSEEEHLKPYGCNAEQDGQITMKHETSKNENKSEKVESPRPPANKEIPENPNDAQNTPEIGSKPKKVQGGVLKLKNAGDGNKSVFFNYQDTRYGPLIVNSDMVGNLNKYLQFKIREKAHKDQNIGQYLVETPEFLEAKSALPPHVIDFYKACFVEKSPQDDTPIPNCLPNLENVPTFEESNDVTERHFDAEPTPINNANENQDEDDDIEVVHETSTEKEKPNPEVKHKEEESKPLDTKIDPKDEELLSMTYANQVKDPMLETELFVCPLCNAKSPELSKVQRHLICYHRMSIDNLQEKGLNIRSERVYL